MILPQALSVQPDLILLIKLKETTQSLPHEITHSRAGALNTFILLLPKGVHGATTDAAITKHDIHEQKTKTLQTQSSANLSIAIR